MAIEITRAAPAGEKHSLLRALPAKRRNLGVKDRMFFTERLELLLATGIPLHDSLLSLARQAGADELQQILRDLAESVASGRSFSQGLAQHPQSFSSTYVNLVAAGEQGGFLPEVLAQLREMDARREELRSTLISAFSYPAFLLVFSLLVVVFVLVLVFPKFEDIFRMIGDDLPITTRLLMALSDLLRLYWAPVLAGIAGLVAVAWHFGDATKAAQTLDRWLLRIPVVRDVAVQYQLVQLMHLLSLSLAHGVPLLDALRASADALPTPRFNDFVKQLQTRVIEGRGVASGFEEADFLPELVPQMIATGESTGSLPLVTGRVADFYERELRKRLEFVAKIAEPLLLLVMGTIVGVIVASLLLPIFKVSTVVR